MQTPYSVYIHIPFCKHRCSYCDFNTYAGQEALLPAYIQALCQEITWVGQSAGRKLPVHTIYFGGGTPSLVSPALFERTLRTLGEQFDLQPDLELTIEANPGTVTLDSLRALHQLGINRLSFGVQSADAQDLRLLERAHDFADVLDALAWARQAGFDNLSIDLIYGIPYQTLESWQRTLHLACDLPVEHISAYSLTVEEGTPLARQVSQGEIQSPDDDLAADMLETALERFAAAGFEQYEVSNWARRRAGKRMECRHNLQYWLNESWLGLGAGGHGYAAGTRTANVLPIGTYIDRMRRGSPEHTFPFSPANESVQSIDRWTEIQETMMLGLRLIGRGVSARAFAQRFGQPLMEAFPQDIDDLIRLGLLHWQDEDALCLTRRGLMVANQVFLRFIG